MRRTLAMTLVAFALLPTATAVSAEPVNNRLADEQAIRANTAALIAAINRGDAAAMAELWTEDGDLLTLAGEMCCGREMLQKQFEQLLSERGNSGLIHATHTVRFLTPNVAIEDGSSQVVPVPPGPPEKAHHTIIHVKQGGKWRIASLRTSLVIPESNYMHLADLEPLVGGWRLVEQGQQPQTIESSFRWTENKNFLIHEFRSKVHEEVVLSGTERIGWDPRTRTIRSWMFGSKGGIIEGQWSKDGESWIIQLSGALGDGTEVKATDKLTVVDDKTLRFESTGRARAGQPEEDRPPIELKRVGP